MQKPKVRSSRNRNFGNNMEALQNAKLGAFFWAKKYGPGGLWRTIFWSKPALYQTRAHVFRRGNSNPDPIDIYNEESHSSEIRLK
jgi:hypothetical protein